MKFTAHFALLTALIAAIYHFSFTGGLNVMAEDSVKKDMDVSHLDENQKYVLLHDGTERAFTGKYWDNKEPGIYVDAITGDPLFSSTDKFDSGTGWPSFTRPIDDNFVAKKEDVSLGMSRTEVRSSHSDGHLGHVFNDGPAEEGGKRYCINSAALEFVPVGELEERGYGKYLSLFVNKPEN